MVDKANELQAIAALQYDSFVEGRCFSEDSIVYKTTTSNIEREAREVYEMLQEKFNQLYGLVKEEKQSGAIQESGDVICRE